MRRKTRRSLGKFMVLLSMAAFLTAEPVQASVRWGCTKTYSKWVAGVGLNVVRAGIGASWWRRAISTATAKAALLVTGAATAGTLIGQGINYGISRRWDPDPIFPIAGDPVFTSITDAEIDAMLPELFGYAGWSDDPTTHFPFTVADLLAADIELHPGIGTAALEYLRASVRTFVDVHQGAAVFWHEGRTPQFYAAQAAIDEDLIALQLATERFAHLISATVVETIDGPEPFESTATVPGCVIDGLMLPEFLAWFDELVLFGPAALPDTEPALVQFLQQIAGVMQPEPIAEDIVAWALGDLDGRQFECDGFGVDGFRSLSDLMLGGIDTFWSRVDLYGSQLVCPADIDGDGFVTLSDLSVMLSNYGRSGDVGFNDGDLNADAIVDLLDLSVMLSQYGSACGWALWSDSFDPYVTGTMLDGQGRWKGWDAVPMPGAVVTNAQSQSPANSVDITGSTDLVHEVIGEDTGKWAFSAWQYIPGDFQSNSSDDFAGTYFILLNRYEDGGAHDPSDWSIQMQFDSNDGMLKVYYGNGLNTVQVPYETDRWVRIRAIVDLDDDWTQVYYDDELIAEYSWTGGILGGGSGASDIAAVDLFANGSSSVFYDDLALEPAQ